MIVRRVRGRGFGAFFINPFQPINPFQTGGSGIFSAIVARRAAARTPAPAPIRMTTLPTPQPEWLAIGSQPGGIFPRPFKMTTMPVQAPGASLQIPILPASTNPTQAPPSIDAASSAVAEKAAATAASAAAPAPSKGGILGAVAAGAGGGLLLGGPVGALLGAGIGGFLASRKKA